MTLLVIAAGLLDSYKLLWLNVLLASGPPIRSTIIRKNFEKHAKRRGKVFKQCYRVVLTHTLTGCAQEKFSSPCQENYSEVGKSIRWINSVVCFNAGNCKTWLFFGLQFLLFQANCETVVCSQAQERNFICTQKYTSVHRRWSDCHHNEQGKVYLMPSTSPDLHFHIEYREHNLKIEMAINKTLHFHMGWLAESSFTLDSGLVDVSCLTEVWAVIWFFKLFKDGFFILWKKPRNRILP